MFSATKIIMYPNLSLTTPTTRVQKVDADIRKLLEDMKEIMLANNGIGLAANQVGVNASAIVMAMPYGMWLGMVNPHIIGKSDEVIEMTEGCLSFPGIRKSIIRPWSVEVEFLDINGKEREINLDGIEGRVVQHEIDHLSGLTFLDRVKEK